MSAAGPGAASGWGAGGSGAPTAPTACLLRHSLGETPILSLNVRLNEEIEKKPVCSAM